VVASTSVEEGEAAAAGFGAAAERVTAPAVHNLRVGGAAAAPTRAGRAT